MHRNKGAHAAPKRTQEQKHTLHPRLLLYFIMFWVIGIITCVPSLTADHLSIKSPERDSAGPRQMSQDASIVRQPADSASKDPTPVTTAVKDNIHDAAQAVREAASQQHKYVLRNDITNIAPNGWKGCSLPIEDQKVMQDACWEYNVPYPLMLGLCQKESGFDPNQISPTNDYGYMQINETNIALLESMGLDIVNNPQDNIHGGVYLFSQHYHNNSEHAHHALMCYNMGAGRARQLWSEGKDSSRYSRLVMSYAAHWEKLLNQEG